MKTKIINADIEQIKKDLREMKGETIVFITDQTVWEIYGEQFEDVADMLWVSPDGEDGKTFENYQECIEGLLEQGIHRNAHIVALGGGAVSDFSGFVAATILRGVSWSVVPTTLLSMVDASIGGKVGINSEFGKNQIGQFYLPDEVWIHSGFLSTLPKEQVQNGRGEILKYAMLSSSINRLVVDGDHHSLIGACAEYKNDLVERDFREKGERKFLNFGHTFGHAFEKSMSIPHGIAVVMGIEYLIKHLADENHRVDLIADFNKLVESLAIESPDIESVKIDLLEKYIRRDKKRVSQNEIELVLLEKIGVPYIKKVSMDEIL